MYEVIECFRSMLQGNKRPHHTSNLLKCCSDLATGILKLHAPTILIGNQNRLEEFEYSNALVDMGSVRT